MFLLHRVKFPHPSFFKGLCPAEGSDPDSSLQRKICATGELSGVRIGFVQLSLMFFSFITFFTEGERTKLSSGSVTELSESIAEQTKVYRKSTLSQKPRQHNLIFITSFSSTSIHLFTLSCCSFLPLLGISASLSLRHVCDFSFHPFSLFLLCSAQQR